MTIFSAIRSLTFVARDVFEAALYLIPAPGLSGYDVDGADLLAEREAAEECSEPLVGRVPPATSSYIAYNINADGSTTEPVFHAQDEVWEADCGLGVAWTDHLGDFPPMPRNYEDIKVQIGGQDDLEPPLTADELVAVRQLIEERFPPSECGESYQDSRIRCELPIGHDGNHFNAFNAYTGGWWNTRNNPQTPVASAPPQTPADATGSDPTLANDPQSVHQRHMRRLLGEDK